jgi:hypothetical protein
VTSEPAFFVGLLLVFTGLACGGVGSLLGRRYRLIIAGGIPFLLAGAMLVYIARERHRFRVTGVAVARVADYVGVCPGEHPVAVRIATAGGAGEVAFRVWVDENFDAPLQVVRVPPNSSFDFATRVRVLETGPATLYAAVDAPNQQVASGAFEITCSEE